MATQKPLKLDTTTAVIARMQSGDTVDPVSLGTGTPDVTQVLRGDGAWAVLAYNYPNDGGL